MGYLELWWWYSKPASVEDKEQAKRAIECGGIVCGLP
jgi:hypothetical protein